MLLYIVRDDAYPTFGMESSSHPSCSHFESSFKSARSSASFTKEAARYFVELSDSHGQRVSSLCRARRKLFGELMFVCNETCTTAERYSVW
jgi:hypothetical protein